jgi:serine/threonine protein kinase
MAELPDRLKAALADRYGVERELGAGGMATVYLAADLRHDRKVALKVLKPELAAVLGAERFVQEIKTTASLQHPHILPLFDSGEADGFLFYVMPYVEGETIRDKLDREAQLGIDEAVRITCEVADALDYAHRNGVIHRDIKPENILLHDGRPMVADFGIALAVSAAAGGRMTETGMSLGTPHYMSPEQATADKAITARSDVYSLASVLYEMLAGQPPHLGGSAQQIIMKIIAEPVASVTTLRKSVPPNVAAALGQALEKLPADRFDSAKAFAEALRDVRFTAAIATAVTEQSAFSTTSRARWTMTAAAVGLALIAGGVGWFLRPVPETQRRPVRFTLPSDSAYTITFSQVAISPDGSLIVYQAATGTSRGADCAQSTPLSECLTGRLLYRRRIDEIDGQPVAGTEGGYAPFFSPDGKQLGFGVDGALRRVSLDGGTPRTVAEYDGSLVSAAWSETDEILFSTAFPPHVYSVAASGGVPRTHAVLDSLAPLDGIGGLHFAAGSDALLFSRGDSVFAAATADDLGSRAIVRASKAWYVPTGHLVYVTDGAIAWQEFDIGTLRTDGSPIRVAEGLTSVLFFGMPVAVSRSGAIAYQRPVRRGYELVMVDREGTQQPLLDDRRFWVPRFSPDGRRVAFGELGLEGGTEDVWIYDFAGGTTSRITLDGLANNDPVWSPDGRRLAISRNGSMEKDLYVVSPEGVDADPDSLLTQEGLQWSTDWSPDGRLVVFTQVNQGGRYDIGVVPVDGGGSSRVYLATPYAELGGRISPDGRWLAYQSDESGQPEVYVQSFPEPGHKQRISTSGGQHPMWGPTGEELFYWDPEEQLIASRVTVSSDEVAVERRDVLFRFPGYVYTGQAQYDVSTDGRRFAIVRGTVESQLIVALDVIGQ